MNEKIEKLRELAKIISSKNARMNEIYPLAAYVSGEVTTIGLTESGANEWRECRKDRNAAEKEFIKLALEIQGQKSPNW